MLPTIHVDQLTLKRWHGKITATESILVAFVRTLSAENPSVEKYMHNGYFRLSRAWVKSMLPILDLSEAVIARHFHELAKLGIMDIKNFVMPGAGTRFGLYGRLSKLYWTEENRAHQDADSRKPHKELESAVDENVHGRMSQTPTAETSIDHPKDDQKREPSPPPHTAAVGSVSNSEEKTSSPPAERAPEEVTSRVASEDSALDFKSAWQRIAASEQKTVSV
jgi:hypothetical protein